MSSRGQTSGVLRVLLLGGGAREHAIASALCKSGRVELYAIAHNYNPGIDLLVKEFESNHSERDAEWIAEWAVARKIDFAVVGLEDPLDVGVPDVLAQRGIPTVGPCRAAAQLETSKLFLRDLMRRHGVEGDVDYRYFDDSDSLAAFLRGTSKEYALKPIGLTAGKGVKVMGVQLNSVDEAIEYGCQVITEQIGGTSGILIEERLIGPEFTLQAFVDGRTVKRMPLVKDFKLAYEGDQGPNTGSMGSYSRADGLLSFVRPEQLDKSTKILSDIVDALRADGIVYQGVMYGQFCMTKQGPKLIEINARFGDPEGINALVLLETDFVDVCEAIAHSTLDQLDVRFQPLATVCKYITPPGYPVNPVVDSPLTLNLEAISNCDVRVYFAKVNPTKDSSVVTTTGSRAIALVGTSQSIEKAEANVEKAFSFIEGEYHARHDIGTGVTDRVPALSW